MGLVDTYAFKASAGKGGDGVVRWRREKFIPKGGPAGGDGGRGGDVRILCIRDILKLGRISHVDSYSAQNGVDGGSNSCDGKNGEDLIIELPLGSVVTNTETGHSFELIREGEEFCLLRGGQGGKGNKFFKSSSNQAPQECTKGEPGEHASFSVELRIIADIGLVGLPNAGKSSLLNALSNAHAKVGAYPFTTISPNLGACGGLVIADIPGIIEGAHEGKGLGRDFLRHIARTGLILHCISLEQDDVVKVYRTIRTELEGFEDGTLNKKQEVVIFTKRDLVTDEVHDELCTHFERETGVARLASISIYDTATLQPVYDLISKLQYKAE